MQKISTCLWFDNNAEEAVNFYKSIFKELEITQISHYPENNMMPEGSVMTVSFKLFGVEYMVLNGGPVYKLTPAFSFILNCDNQEEIDYYWDRLTDGGKEVECGWVTDKFGISWQVIPSKLGEWMKCTDPVNRLNGMKAIWSMKKLDIAAIDKAFKGE